MLPHHSEVDCASNLSLSVIEGIFEFCVALIEKILNANAEVNMRSIGVTKSGIKANVIWYWDIGSCACSAWSALKSFFQIAHVVEHVIELDLRSDVVESP